MVPGQCLKGELSNDVPYINLGLSFCETLRLTNRYLGKICVHVISLQKAEYNFFRFFNCVFFSDRHRISQFPNLLYPKNRVDQNWLQFAQYILRNSQLFKSSIILQVSTIGTYLHSLFRACSLLLALYSQASEILIHSRDTSLFK